MDDTDPAYTDMLINLCFRQRDARLWRAVALAPSLDVCEALLRGEHVPLNRLDPYWVQALHHEDAPGA